VITTALICVSFLFLAVAALWSMINIGVVSRRMLWCLSAGYLLSVFAVHQFGFETYGLAVATVNVVAGCGITYAAGGVR
jgi:hypothetical protein